MVALRGTRDALGFEEVGQTGSQAADIWITGSFTGEGQISGANIYGGTAVTSAVLSGTTIINAGSMRNDVTYSSPGSPYYQGNVLRFTSETIITGGMWVVVSGAAGGASVLAKAAAASTNAPLGVAIATAGSNATVSVLTRGLTYLTADGTISNGDAVRMSAGAALNTVATTTNSGARGVALAGAGSEGIALVYLW